jgi:hypothetical protein
MQTYRLFTSLLIAGLALILGGCLNDGEGSVAGTSGGAPVVASTAADFFHLAVVPDQTVTSATFEVQVIAENIDPASPPSAPIVTDAGGGSYTMVPKTLQWPGTALNSVTIYSAVVPLLANQVNNLNVNSAAKNISFSIKHKAALNIQHAVNAAGLIALIQSAHTDATIDVIEVDYAEADLGLQINNIVSGATSRNSWLTVRPGTGSITWLRDSPLPFVPSTIRRPKMDFLNLDGVTFGSPTSDGGGYQYYVEPGHRVWLSNVTFQAKYNVAWSRETIITAPYLADVRVDATEAQKIYLTDCSWQGTAPNAATQSVQLARDLRFDSHRGDINQFGKVILNVSAQNMFAVKTVAAPVDYTHNDGFQVWGPASGIAIKGIRVTSSPEPAYLQPFLFDRTFTPDYSYILVDSIQILGASVAGPGAPTTVDRAQLAGVISNSRISNISFSEQGLAIRRDFTEPNGAFTPTNVRIHNVDVWGVEYSPPAPGASVVYSSAYGTVAGDPANIATVLNSNPGLAGATFSNVKVK